MNYLHVTRTRGVIVAGIHHAQNRPHQYPVDTADLVAWFRDGYHNRVDSTIIDSPDTMPKTRPQTLEDLFTPEEIQRLCDPCRHADHYRDWPDRGAHAPEMVLIPPAQRCPCDLRCMKAHPDWESAIGTLGR